MPKAFAFYRGEAQERRQLGTRFEDIRRNWWDIMHTTKRLNIAVNFYGQFSIIFPLLVSSPRYFAGVISLGVVMQIASAFGQVQDALSWFIYLYHAGRLEGQHQPAGRFQSGGGAGTAATERHRGGTR